MGHTSRHSEAKQQSAPEEIESFLDLIFSQIGKGEQIPLWASARSTPGFPINEKAFTRAATRGRAPMACYFGCSTMRFDKGGALRNRQSLFAGFYVLVLDDIGTGSGSKIKPEDVPAGLQGTASYRIETSPGNEQWGYVLREPIRDLEFAKIFQKLIIDKAGTDGGGCMPNKLVRMPLGVNLKPKYRSSGGVPFACRLIESDWDALWTPGEFLAAVDAGVTWETLKARAHAGTLVTRRAGTTVYRTTAPYHSDLDGIVDPILEWLAREDRIYNDSGDWIDIKCPWAAGHTDTGSDSAGYSPIGRGDRPTMRAFHCFHDACKGYRTSEFLAQVFAQGGPRSSAHATIEAHLARYAFDMEGNSFVDMKSETLTSCSQTGFKNQLSADVWVPKADGTSQAVNEYTLFMKDRSRMRFAGRRAVVGGRLTLLSPSGGYPYLNVWRLPEWGDGPFDESKVLPFVQFMEYLIPNPAECAWFLEHLASKAQDPFYRGPGVIMSTPVEGTGRGTLYAILARLWGAYNTTSITLSELISGASSAAFNPWVSKDWIMVPEAKETDMSAKKEHTAYESLKQFIEPGPSRIQMKQHYTPVQDTICYGSVIISSQHRNVLPVDAGGTRFRRLSNTVTPRTPTQFSELYAWIVSGFEPHLWRWLRARDVSHIEKFARVAPLSLGAELAITIEGERAIDSALLLCIMFSEDESGGVVLTGQLLEGLTMISEELGLAAVAGWAAVLRRELVNRTQKPVTADGKHWRPRVGGSQLKIRTTNQPNGLAVLERISGTGGKSVEAEMRTRGSIRDAFIVYARSALSSI